MLYLSQANRVTSFTWSVKLGLVCLNFTSGGNVLQLQVSRAQVMVCVFQTTQGCCSGTIMFLFLYLPWHTLFAKCTRIHLQIKQIAQLVRNAPVVEVLNSDLWYKTESVECKNVYLDQKLNTFVILFCFNSEPKICLHDCIALIYFPCIIFKFCKIPVEFEHHLLFQCL